MLERFRTKLISRGAKGAFGLERQFHIFDLDESGDLSRDEFKKAVSDYKLDMDERDLNNLFKMFDKNNDGKISYHEFMVTIIGRMNEFRKNIVKRAFENLDIEEEGTMDFDYIKTKYRASMHPDVRLGKKTEDEEYNEFLSTFTVHHSSYGGPEARVTKDEFMEYYTKISAAIENNSNFDVMMTDVWGLGLQGNAQRLPYAGATSKIYQVNSKNIWKFDHHREMLTGKGPLKDEDTKHAKSIYEMSVASSSPHKHSKAEYPSEKPKPEVKEYCLVLNVVDLIWKY
jgi:Ca2+-binding EF-hand superfamily protein